MAFQKIKFILTFSISLLTTKVQGVDQHDHFVIR